MLEIAGCIVTIDAMGCQKEIAQAIVNLDADYVLAVKENQGHLYEDVTGLFAAAQDVNFKDVPHDYYKTTDKGHGRLEIRQCWTISDDRAGQLPAQLGRLALTCTRLSKSSPSAA